MEKEKSKEKLLVVGQIVSAIVSRADRVGVDDFEQGLNRIVDQDSTTNVNITFSQGHVSWTLEQLIKHVKTCLDKSGF